MKKRKLRFIYPALFVKDEDEYQVIFPDLNIFTQGKNLSETYIFAKDLLHVYFTYAVKYDIDFNMPSKLETILAKCKANEIAMYVDTMIEKETN